MTYLADVATEARAETQAGDLGMEQWLHGLQAQAQFMTWLKQSCSADALPTDKLDELARTTFFPKKLCSGLHMRWKEL